MLSAEGIVVLAKTKDDLKSGLILLGEFYCTCRWRLKGEYKKLYL